MKHLFIFLIVIYQKLFSPILRNIFGDFCRFTPQCSEYAKISIKEKGVLKGTQLAITRVLKCQPFYGKPFNLKYE